MLEVEDIEDVSCTADDMEATDRLQSLVQRGWSEGRGDKRTRAEMMDVSSVSRRRKTVETPVTGNITALFGPGFTSPSVQTLREAPRNPVQYRYRITDYCTYSSKLLQRHVWKILYDRPIATMMTP
jgi:hypothetical protein